MEDTASNTASTNGGPPPPPQPHPTNGDRETASVSPPTVPPTSLSAAPAATLQNPSKLYEEAAAATAAAAGLTSLGSHLHSASSYMNMSQSYPYAMMGNGTQMENSVVTSCSSGNAATGGYSYSPASNMSPSCMSMNNGQPPQATTPPGKKSGSRNGYFAWPNLTWNSILTPCKSCLCLVWKSSNTFFLSHFCNDCCSR